MFTNSLSPKSELSSLSSRLAYLPAVLLGMLLGCKPFLGSLCGIVDNLHLVRNSDTGFRLGDLEGVILFKKTVAELLCLCRSIPDLFNGCFGTVLPVGDGGYHVIDHSGGLGFEDAEFVTPCLCRFCCRLYEFFDPIYSDSNPSNNRSYFFR